MQTTLPLVTICCTTYNQENYIRDAIEGFLMQETTFPIEIIIHDDASTDNTANIVKEYAEKHPALIVPIFQTENQYSQGIKPWPNFVFPRARGKYIALCEGDDYWTDPLKLQKQVDFLEENETYSLVFHGYNVLQNGNFKTRDIKLKETLNQADYAKVLSGVHTLTVVFRNILNKIDSIDYTYGSYYLFLRISEYGLFKFLNEPMAVYRIHQGGIYSGKSFFEQSKMSLKNKALMIDFYRHNKRLRNILINTYVRFSIHYAISSFVNRSFKQGLFFLSTSFNYGLRIGHIFYIPNYIMNKIQR